MSPKSPFDSLITVYGGSGFLGRHVVRALAKRHYRIRVAVRRPDLAGHLQPLGRVGQIHAVQANVRDPVSVEGAARDADALINLVGILAEGGRQRFDAVHMAGAEAVAKAAAASDARMIHVSAIGADENSTAEYARSKGLGEQRVIENVPGAVVFRPSIMFGPDDTFFNRFAALARLSPVLPLIGGGLSRFSPVFVGDVAAAIADAVDGRATPGTIYELGGPDTLTFKELMQFTLKTIERTRILLPIPFALARPLAMIAQFFPGAPLTPDQVEMLRSDNVVSDAARREGRTFEAFGIVPDSIAAIVPAYLWRFRKFGQFSRRHA
jgi:uncharacterized protein YbjT (DUF2867 family)